MSENSPEPEQKTPIINPEGQQELFPASSFLQIERQRIDSYNRRTEVASQAVAASNEADKRQFDYQMASLKFDEDSSKRTDALARILVFGIGTTGIAVVCLFLIMAFFGNASQSSTALQILGVLAVGGGGYGIISGITNLIRGLMRSK